MAATAEAARCAAADEYEALRLLYVGWTRARDILILAARPGKLGDGMFGLFVKDGKCLISEPEDDSALWAGKRVDCRVRECAPAEERAAPSPTAEEYILPAAKTYPPAFIAPSSIERGSALIVESSQIHKALAVSKGRIDADFGMALHAIIASDKEGRPSAERIASITAILERWGISASVSPNDILSALDSFYAWIAQRWPHAQRFREWPLDMIDAKGSLIRGMADHVLMTEEGFTVIDHKSYLGAFEEAKDRLSNYGGQLFAYATAIKTATGKPCLGTWLHFPLAGTVIRIK
jgi:ATP-dependent exoDNAse (exonuclease V) beta subunit